VKAGLHRRRFLPCAVHLILYNARAMPKLNELKNIYNWLKSLQKNLFEKYNPGMAYQIENLFNETIKRNVQRLTKR
jgi:hypothetical protein